MPPAPQLPLPPAELLVDPAEPVLLIGNGGGDVELVHTENAERWRELRGQTRRLIAWIRRMHAQGRDLILGFEGKP